MIAPPKILYLLEFSGFESAVDNQQSLSMIYFFSPPGSGVYKRAPGSFLFSLVNPSGLPPTKMPLIAGKEGYAICCNESYGPLFGGNSSHDLYIPNSPNSPNSCSVNLNNAYQCPTGQNAETFLTGNQNFTVNEMEVFGFEQ